MDSIQGMYQGGNLNVQPPPPREEQEPPAEEEAEVTEVRESGSSVDTYA